MTGKNIITINGRDYDAITGRPLATPAPSAAHHSPHPPHNHSPKPHRAFVDIAGPAPLRHTAPSTQTNQTPGHAEVKAKAVHKQLQKSQTLNRSAIRKPIPFKPFQPVPVRIEADQAQPTTPTPPKPTVVHHRSPAITKFAPVEQHARVTAPQPLPPADPELLRPVRPHPVVAKAMTNQPVPAQPTQSPQELKDSLIRERLAQAKPNHHQVKRRRFIAQPRLATILTSSLAMILLAGYLTYINLPNISMRVAATRAGIAANYPNYQPDGYHFAGPITYQPGEVNITFKSNTNQNDFVIKQKTSSWDSQAVLDNYVNKKTGNYLTYQERGLTIYSFGNHAAWVNGGLLYTIDGDAPLSSDQLLHIATSM